MNSRQTAVVLKTGNRFFANYKDKRIATAWSLAGAKLFLWDNESKLSYYENILQKKGYKVERKYVSLIENDLTQ